jgi:hypothetical protein
MIVYSLFAFVVCFGVMDIVLVDGVCLLSNFCALQRFGSPARMSLSPIKQTKQGREGQASEETK